MSPKTPVAPLEAAIHVDASPAAVWAIVSDQRRMNERSPETFKQKFFGDGLKVGTRSLNLNKRKGFVWPTATRVTEVVPEQRLRFYVYGSASFWSYDLEAVDGGTRLTERRDLKGGKRSVASKVTAALALGGITEHDVELLAGMRTTLEHIKAEAERG
jgi:hypothetical protein